jgi:hypothetical protein
MGWLTYPVSSRLSRLDGEYVGERNLGCEVC